LIGKEDFMGSRFEFDNPNAAAKCGCGTTFSV
jgi:Fe-S cluster assembly iron-binding protein IscA